MPAAIYTRQSIEKKDSESIETQLEYAKKYINSNEPFDIYTDAGFSGKNTMRPGFQRMLEGIENGKYDKVIVYKLDRISRNVADFSWLMELMKKHECTFISAKENFSLDTPAGRAMLYMTSTFAQMERESTSERVKDNYYERLKIGVVGGGPPPLGYDLSSLIVMGKKHTVYKTNSQIELIKTMFELYTLPSYSLADVKKQLELKYDITIQTSDISRRLKNPTYVKADAQIYNYYYKRGALMGSDIECFDGIHGCLIAGRRKSSDRKYTNVKNHIITVGLHEGAVNSTQFLICQNKLAQNTQLKNKYKGKYSWLSGVIKCGICGYAMVVKRYMTKDGNISKFYCANGCQCGTSHYVDMVESIIQSALEEKMKTINCSIAPHKDQNSKKKALLCSQAAEVNAKIENLVLKIEQASDLTLKYINSRINELDAIKADIEHQIAIDEKTLEKQYIIDIGNGFNNLSYENKKMLSRISIDKVIIFPDNSIIVFWKL